MKLTRKEQLCILMNLAIVTEHANNNIKVAERCRSPGRGRGHHHRGGHHSPGRGGHRGGCGHGPGHHHHGHGHSSGSSSPSPERPGDTHGSTGHGPVVSGQPYFPPTLDIYRSWNGQLIDHFYTVDLAEHFNAVQHLGYANEGKSIFSINIIYN